MTKLTLQTLDQRLKNLEYENAQLKFLLADLTGLLVKHQALPVSAVVTWHATLLAELDGQHSELPPAIYTSLRHLYQEMLDESVTALSMSDLCLQAQLLGVDLVKKSSD